MIRNAVSLPPTRSRAAFTPVCLHKEYASAGRSARPSSSSLPLLSRPEDVVLELVTLLRKADLTELAPYVPDDLLAPPGTAVLVAGVPVHEQGPLARCSAFMDTAARRVLPGHLLRRSRILSSLQLGGSALLRVALTACTGEELVLSWRLGLTQLPGTCAVTQQQQQQQQQQQAGEPSSSSSSGGGGSLLEGNIVGFSGDGGGVAGPHAARAGCTSASASSDAGNPTKSSSSSSSSSSSGGSSSPSKSCWQVLSCTRDASGDADCLPVGPHPRTSPELVVLAQLRALQSRQLMAAATLNMLGRHASGSGWQVHLAAFKHLLAQPQYQPLVSHSSRVELGSSALPSQRHFLQEVLLFPDNGSGGGEPARFLIRLGMQSNGSWMTRSIEAL